MKAQSMEKEDARERILSASTHLFAEKGFDATSVNAIAEAAGVNKALIYYYFKNKEAILETMLHSLSEDLAGISMNFTRDFTVQMIHDGRLDILSDRFRFRDQDSLDYFIEKANVHFQQLLDHMLAQKLLIRILMLESLKRTKHQQDLFWFSELIPSKEASQVYRVINEADSDFIYNQQFAFTRFFFFSVPVVSFVAYFDDYCLMMSIQTSELRQYLLKTVQFILPHFVTGLDILLPVSSTENIQ